MYQAIASQTVTIGEHSVCYHVTNATASAIMVPTNTSGEWSSFYNNFPTNVTKVPACCSASPNTYTVSDTFTMPAGCNYATINKARGGGACYCSGGCTSSANGTIGANPADPGVAAPTGGQARGGPATSGACSGTTNDGGTGVIKFTYSP